MWGDVEILAKMPCWYFDRKQIKNSPSFLSGIDTNTENRYRREGARFIIDAGTKMGLRWDTCATGVVFFHRFYMFHSFKEFYRYVTAACCLFLAGKVEETPKKCRDVIKIAQNLLSSASFAKFGDDPREEVMTMERCLLKTIKFDFNIEHPYSHLLKYAKNFKCEKEKIQNMAQMAWTFINDSLCTTLCLQWEPEIVCISLMYLASRLTKFEPSDWSSRTGTKSKWWEDWLEGMSMELMEDICHQVLDLYSNKSKKQMAADSPPNSPVKSLKVVAADSTPPPPPDRPPPIKRSREEEKPELDAAPKTEHREKEVKYNKPAKPEAESNSSSAKSTADDAAIATGAPIPVAQHLTPTQYRSATTSNSNSNNARGGESDSSYSSYNPYVSASMFSSSFMSQEGSQNIQSILAGTSAPPPSAAPPPVYSDPQPPSHHGAPDVSQYPPPTASVPPNHTSHQYPYPPPQTQYAAATIPAPHSYHPAPSNQPPPTYDPYNPPVTNPPSYPPHSTYSAPPPVSISSYIPPPTHPPLSNSYPYPPPHLPPPSIHPQRPASYHPPPSHPYPTSSTGDPHQSYGGVSRNYSSIPSNGGTRKDIPSLTEVKITGRPEWNMNK